MTRGGKRPGSGRKRKPRPVVAPLAPEDDPAVLKAVAPELHAALMKAYDGKRCALHFLELSPGMPRAVWRRALVCSCGCGCTYVDGYKSMYVYGVSHAYGSTDCDSNKQLNMFRV